MTSIERLPATEDDDIDLMVLWRVVWGYKYFIAGVTLLFAVVAAAVALNMVPTYRAEAVVTEVSDTQPNGLASLAGQFGGLASLAGINLTAGATGGNAKAVLQSRRLAEEFIRRNDLMSTLYADDPEPPSMWFAVKMFRDSVLSIRDNQANGVIAIAMDWNDPVVASRWANDFVALANESIRSRALEDAKRNIAYLEQQAARTDVVELRNVLYNLIESETQTLMLANGKLEYAFTIVDPAVPPEMRISPQRTLMVLAGMLFGTALGTIIAFSHSMLLRYRRRTRATYDAGTASAS